MNGQMHTIELYMLVVGISLMIGLMFSAYSRSASELRVAGERRMSEISVREFCMNFPKERIRAIDKKIGELMAIYNLTGDDILVFENRYIINLTDKINTTLESFFGKSWSFDFGAMNLGYPAPSRHLGCRIYVPSLRNRGYTYAILKVW